MGRPLHSSRNKWQYYTMSDKNKALNYQLVKMAEVQRRNMVLMNYLTVIRFM